MYSKIYIYYIGALDLLNVGNDARDPTDRRIEKAAIVAQSKISFDHTELLQLMYTHLQSSGLFQAAEVLREEAALDYSCTITDSVMKLPPTSTPHYEKVNFNANNNHVPLIQLTKSHIKKTAVRKLSVISRINEPVEFSTSLTLSLHKSPLIQVQKKLDLLENIEEVEPLKNNYNTSISNAITAVGQVFVHKNNENKVNSSAITPIPVKIKSNKNNISASNNYLNESVTPNFVNSSNNNINNSNNNKGFYRRKRSRSEGREEEEDITSSKKKFALWNEEEVNEGYTISNSKKKPSTTSSFVNRDIFSSSSSCIRDTQQVYFFHNIFILYTCS